YGSGVGADGASRAAGERGYARSAPSGRIEYAMAVGEPRDAADILIRDCACLLRHRRAVWDVHICTVIDVLGDLVQCAATVAIGVRLSASSSCGSPVIAATDRAPSHAHCLCLANDPCEVSSTLNGQRRSAKEPPLQVGARH